MDSVGIPLNSWESNGDDLREVVKDAVHSYTSWAHGYRKYERDSYEIVGGLLQRLERRDLCLSFLAKEILNSELQDKPLILEKLTSSAYESPETEDYPIVETLDFLRKERGTLESPERLLWKDTFSNPKCFKRVLEALLESDSESTLKAAAYIRMVADLKERKKDHLSRKLTDLFFNLDGTPHEFRKKLARLLVDTRFLIRTVSGLLAYEDIPIYEIETPERAAEILSERMSQDFGWEAAGKIGCLLASQRPRKLSFHAEKRYITKWFLESAGREEAKSFIEPKLGEDYGRRDYPVIRGLLDFLEEWDERDSEFTREVIDVLKDANRYQVRLEAYKAGYSLFEDEKYLEEGANDQAETVRDWAKEVKS